MALKRLTRLPLLCGLLAFVAHGKLLYVDTATGNDATPYAQNDATHPWATIARAAWGSTTYLAPNPSQAAQGGDTVLIPEGLYGENGN